MEVKVIALFSGLVSWLDQIIKEVKNNFQNLNKIDRHCLTIKLVSSFFFFFYFEISFNIISSYLDCRFGTGSLIMQSV